MNCSSSMNFNFQNIVSPTNILIGYHMGCPDGVASAYILKVAFDKLGFKYKIVPIGHSGKKFANYVEPGQTVFSVDISPSMEDVDALQSVQQLIILDHHASEIETQAKLSETLSGKVTNLSDVSGDHCGASLVHEMVLANVDGLQFDPDVIHMIHKMDVFQYKMPAHLDARFLSFKSFLIQDGERNVSFGLMEKIFTDTDNSMTIGHSLSQPIIECTARLFESCEVLIDVADFCVLLCFQGADCRPIDFFLYQEHIDTKCDGKPILFLTQDELPNAKGIFNLGLRRAGEFLDVSKVASALKACKSSPFVSGGGHPFAGGVQSNVLVSREELTRLTVEALTTVYAPMPAVDGGEPTRENFPCVESTEEGGIPRPAKLLRLLIAGLLSAKAEIRCLFQGVVVVMFAKGLLRGLVKRLQWYQRVNPVRKKVLL